MQYISVTKKGNYIHDCGYDDKGKKYKRKVKYKPKVYLESNNPNCNIKTLFGKSTTEITFDSMKEYNEYTYKNKRLEVHGVISPEYQYIRDVYKTDEIYIKPKVWAIDLECVTDIEFPSPEFVKYEINSASIHDFKSGKFYQWSLKDYDKHKNKIDVDPDLILFKKCDSEKELLESMIQVISKGFPDILVGYFSEGFDFPYLIKRCTKVLGKNETNKLSPFNNVSCSLRTKLNRSTGKDEKYFVSKIDGIILLDYLELYKKYIFTPRESYKLDFIASEELGENKVDYEEYDNLYTLWVENEQKFIDYNIVDTKLIKELDDKLGLIELNSSITYKARCNHADTLGTLKVWEAYLYDEMINRNICLPPRRDHKKESYPGAYVKEPVKGLYEWIMSFDYDSLYPLTMCQYNISPEVFIENLSIDVNQEEVDTCFFDPNFKNPNPNHILTAAGNYFRKDKKGIIPVIVEKLFNERTTVKKEMLVHTQEYENTKDKSLQAKISKANNTQMAVKILLNSLYGAMANKHFIFYDIRFARSITLSAQLATRWTEKYIESDKDLNKYKIKSIYCDTDSDYFDCSHIVNTLLSNRKITNDKDDIADFLNKFANDKIQPVIKEACNKLSERMSCDNYMNMSREAICSSGFWTGKKKYALFVIDNEGVRYKEPKLKVTGIEIVRSSTPASVKPFLRRVLTKILEKDDISKYISNCRTEYLELSPAQIAFPRGANNFEKWYQEKGFKKGTPIGVRAAFIFNKYVDQKKLEAQYTKIKSGDKIKFTYIRQPNILSDNVVGFLRRLPDELHKCVDYDMMWEKSFMSVVRSICEKIDIEYEARKVNVNDLF